MMKPEKLSNSVRAASSCGPGYPTPIFLIDDHEPRTLSMSVPRDTTWCCCCCCGFAGAASLSALLLLLLLLPPSERLIACSDHCPGASDTSTPITTASNALPLCGVTR